MALGLPVAGVLAASLPGAVTPGGAAPRFELMQEAKPAPSLQAPPEEVSPAAAEEAQAPRMLLRGFDLRGVGSHPEQGIDVAAVRAVIEREVARLAPAGQPRLFSIGMFEQITQAVTRFYRQRGFFLARAFIPEQKVQDGIVRIEVVETRLDQVVFDGNRLYQDDIMSILFEELLDQPLRKEEVEQALFRLNDYPGLQAGAIFGPGRQRGSAAMLIRVRETAAYNLLSLDNYGSAYTGETRLMYRHRSNNLLGQADSLSLNLMSSMIPAYNQYADVLYAQPVWRSRLRLGGGLRLNRFQVGEELEDLNINGQSLVFNLFTEYPLLRSRNDSLSLLADLSLKSATSKVVSTVASEDKLTVLRADLLYSGVDRWLWPASHDFSLSFSFGLAGVLGAMDENGNGLSGRRGGSGQRAGGDFSKINLSYTRNQPTLDFQRLQIRLQAQYSDDLLTSLEQFSLGGPYSVRAYPTAEALVDNAVFLSLEYFLQVSPEVPQTWLYGLQLSLFYDHAQGSINDPLVNEPASASLSGFGLGLQVEPMRLLRARLDLAQATGDKASDLRSLPFYFSLEYRF